MTETFPIQSHYWDWDRVFLSLVSNCETDNETFELVYQMLRLRFSVQWTGLTFLEQNDSTQVSVSVLLTSDILSISVPIIALVIYLLNTTVYNCWYLCWFIENNYVRLNFRFSSFFSWFGQVENENCGSKYFLKDCLVIILANLRATRWFVAQ